MAQEINRELAAAGFNNLGTSVRKDLAVLRRTQMPGCPTIITAMTGIEINKCHKNLLMTVCLFHFMYKKRNVSAKYLEMKRKQSI